MFEFLLSRPLLFQLIAENGGLLGVFCLMLVAYKAFSRMRLYALILSNEKNPHIFDELPQGLQVKYKKDIAELSPVEIKDFSIASGAIDWLIMGNLMLIAAIILMNYQETPLSKSQIEQAQTFYTHRPEVVSCLKQKSLALNAVLLKQDLLQCALKANPPSSVSNNESLQKQIQEQKEALQSESSKLYSVE